MMEDLEGGDDLTKVNTLQNLVECPPDIDEALPLLRQAMTDPRRRVRDLAEQAISRLAEQLDVHSIAPYEAVLSQRLHDVAILTLVLSVYLIAESQPTARAARQQLTLRVIREIPGIRLPSP